jgi:hypothetical protein
MSKSWEVRVYLKEDFTIRRLECEEDFSLFARIWYQVRDVCWLERKVFVLADSAEEALSKAFKSGISKDEQERLLDKKNREGHSIFT